MYSYKKGAVGNLFLVEGIVMGKNNKSWISNPLKALRAWAPYTSVLIVVASATFYIGMLHERVGRLEAQQESGQGDELSSEFSSLRNENREGFSDLRSGIMDLRGDILDLTRTINAWLLADSSTSDERFMRINFNPSVLGNMGGLSGDLGLSVPSFAFGGALGGDSLIGTDEYGNELSFADVANKRIYTYFIDNNGILNWFYGIINENGHWDGEVILNAYNANGDLIAIFEATFDNGRRIGEFTAMSRTNEGFLSIRRGAYNIGYTRGTAKVYRHGFLSDDARSESSFPIRVTDFVLLDDDLERYYRGEIRNGRYNDETGDAFLIINNADGTVRIFYSGKFKDGYFVDSSDNAFWIVLANDESQYLFYQGSFANGQPTNSDWFELPNARIPQYKNPLHRISELTRFMSFDLTRLSWRVWQ